VGTLISCSGTNVKSNWRAQRFNKSLNASRTTLSRELVEILLDEELAHGVFIVGSSETHVGTVMRQLMVIHGRG